MSEQNPQNFIDKYKNENFSKFTELKESVVIEHKKVSTPMPHNKFKSFFKGALDVSPIKPFNFKFWQKSSAKKNNNLKADTVVNLDFNINVQVQESTPNVDPDESRDNLKESWNFPD